MTIIEMTVTGALMILGVIVLRAVSVSKLPKRAFIIMWEIALLRLILPISVPVKILPAVQTVTVIDSPSSYDIVAEPVRNDFVLVIPEEVREFIPSSAPAPVSVPTPPAANTPSFTVTPQMIWIAGAVVLAVFFAISYLRSMRRFRSAKQCDSDFIRGWLLEHPIWRPLSVKVSRAVSSPLTYGFLNPVILLPPEYENADERSLGFVLEHEYAHIRHFDALKKLVCTAVLCVHWFNPLMWVLYLLYNRDIELWCDESVIKKFGATSRAQYARLLISIEESRSAGVPLLSHFGRSTTEERIVSIMKFKKTTIITAIVAALLIAVTTITIIATSINPVPKEAEDDTSNVEVGSFPINVFIDSETSQKYYSVYDKYAVAIAPEDEEMFASSEYFMTPEELDEWVHREIDRILGLTEGNMFYDSDANMLVGYDAIGEDYACDTLRHHMAESLGATVGIVAAPVFTIPVNLVFTERYVTPNYNNDSEVSSNITWGISGESDETADSAVTWSVSYSHPAGGDVSSMKTYFDYTKNKWKIRDEVPIIEDPELYAVSVDTRVETDALTDVIQPSISAVAGNDYTAIAVIEVDTKDLVLPENMPEDAVLQFKEAAENFYWTGSWFPIDLVSQNETVYTYGIGRSGIDRWPRKMNIKLRDFGYYDGDKFVTLVKGTYSLTVDADKFNTTEKLKKISEPAEVRGVELELELTPFGLVVKGSYSRMNELGLYSDKYFLTQGDFFDFCLRDGSVVGEEEYYFDTAFYGLTWAWTGWVDFDNDIAYHHFGFMVPVDVEEIEAVMVHGVRFDLKYAE